MNAGALRGLLDASLSAGIMILMAAALRAGLQQKADRRVFCLAWDMCLARLLVPVAICSPLSIWRHMHVATVADAARSMSVVSYGAANIARENGAAVSETAVCEAAPAGSWLWVAWLAGALILCAWFAAGHVLSRRIYAQSLPCRSEFVLAWLDSRPLRRRVRVRVCDRIASPLTYGLARPVILLPASMDWADASVLRCVLEHEYEHIRRLDTLRKALLCAVLCVYWFSPLVWLLYVLASRDMELACDQAVLRQGEDRERYALALLSMEERRESWTLAGSHFSSNALKERITTIMKRRKMSLMAIVAVVLVMVVATVAIAAAAPDGVETEQRSSAEFDSTQVTGAVAEESGVAVKEENGQRVYSLDGGDTWISEEEFAKDGTVTSVQWWTADEYEKWLEQEKKNLESCIGTTGYTSSDGWFTWDRQRVDETIAEYEKVLEDIRNGALYSRTVTTDENGLVAGEVIVADGTSEETLWQATETGDALAVTTHEDELDMQALEQYGLATDAEGHFTLNGERVRAFVDGVDIDGTGAIATRCSCYFDSEGTVDAHALYEATDNGDGSTDPMGKLVGIAKKGDPRFNQSLVDGVASAMEAAESTSAAAMETALAPAGDGSRSVCIVQDEAVEVDGVPEMEGRTLEDMFRPFEAFGLRYDSLDGSLTYRGQPVSSFADLAPDGSAFTLTTDTVDGLKVTAQYDASGRLTGVEVR